MQRRAGEVEGGNARPVPDGPLRPSLVAPSDCAVHPRRLPPSSATEAQGAPHTSSARVAPRPARPSACRAPWHCSQGHSFSGTPGRRREPATRQHHCPGGAPSRACSCSPQCSWSRGVCALREGPLTVATADVTALGKLSPSVRHAHASMAGAAAPGPSSGTSPQEEAFDGLLGGGALTRRPGCLTPDGTRLALCCGHVVRLYRCAFVRAQGKALSPPPLASAVVLSPTLVLCLFPTPPASPLTRYTPGDTRVTCTQHRHGSAAPGAAGPQGGGDGSRRSAAAATRLDLRPPAQRRGRRCFGA